MVHGLPLAFAFGTCQRRASGRFVAADRILGGSRSATASSCGPRNFLITAPDNGTGTRQVDYYVLSFRLKPSPMSAPTATPATAKSPVSRSTLIGLCLGFVLSGRNST